MQTKFKVVGVGIAIAVLLVPDVLEAQVGHVHRATRRRTAVVVGSAASSQNDAEVAAANAAANQSAADAAAAEQDADQARAEAAAAQQQLAQGQATQQQAAAAPAAVTGPLPIGAVVSVLPDGCPAFSLEGVEYHQCNGNTYRAVFQGNQLVFATVQPPKPQ
jgi:hypothetical protein